MSTDTLTNLKQLNVFLRKHKTINFRTTDLLNTAGLENFTWPSDETQRHTLLGQVKSYQRLLRVLPTSDELPAADLAKKLMKMGINSAFQITQMGKDKFLANTNKIFSQCPEVATTVYKRALVSRKLVATKYIRHQQNLEPHARTVGLNL